MPDTYPRSLQLHIDGEWVEVEGRDIHHVVNPSTGKIISDLPKATKADLDRALDAAGRAFPVWRDTPIAERGAILRKAANLMRERAPEIGRLMTAEQGKPLAQAIGEVSNSANMLTIWSRKPSVATAAFWCVLRGNKASSNISRLVRSRRSARGTSPSSPRPGNWPPRLLPVARSS